LTKTVEVSSKVGLVWFGSVIRQESPANAKGTHDSSACMKAHCEQM